MTDLLANIEFAQGGNSDFYVREGWAEPESTHRWTMGRESRMVLPVETLGPECVIVINATPCVHPPDLPAQSIMLAVNDRLLASAVLPGLRVLAFRVPASLAGAERPELRITHLNVGAPRAPEQYRRGQPLGLMMHSLRIYRLAWQHRAARAPWPDTPEAQALCFESIGQGCQFGQIQRQMGAEPLNLLRFVDTVTSNLADGIVRSFAGIDTPGSLEIGQAVRSKPTYRWRQTQYDLHFDTLIPVDQATPAQVMRDQLTRLRFLRQKFEEDLHEAGKIYVLTRSDCLTEAEALAIYCALNAHADNTLLWTVYGDPAATGQVDRLAPGFLCGHLGATDEVRFAPLAAWEAVMKNAYGLA